MSGMRAIVQALLNTSWITAPLPYVSETSTSSASGGFALDSDGVRAGPVMPATRDQSVTGAVPAMAIFVLPTGGPRSTPFMGGGQEEPTTYQIIVRSPPRDMDVGDALATVVYEALNMKPPTGYFDSRWFPPHYLREDPQNQHEFVINGMLKRSTA